MQINEVMKRVHTLERDHDADGWPAVCMRDLTMLRCEILELRAKLNTQQAGVRAVLKAAVELVCAPAWAGVSDEDLALEQALRDAGFVQPNEQASRARSVPLHAPVGRGKG
jgi:hypothetical protein